MRIPCFLQDLEFLLFHEYLSQIWIPQLNRSQHKGVQECETFETNNKASSKDSGGQVCDVRRLKEVLQQYRTGKM